jgi:hypothetical protein
VLHSGACGFECVEVCGIEAAARSLLAATDVDVAQRTVIDVRGELLDGDVEVCGSLACGEQTGRIADQLGLGLPVEIKQLAQPVALTAVALLLLGLGAVVRGLHHDGELVARSHATSASGLQSRDPLLARCDADRRVFRHVATVALSLATSRSSRLMRAIIAALVRG